MTNLLRNPSFGGGTYPPREPFRSGAWPNDWERDFWYSPGDETLETGSVWMLDESIVLKYRVQFPEAHLIYDPSDDFILHCFWNGAIGGAWMQTNDLPAGQYRYVVPVFPDQWHEISAADFDRMNQYQPHKRGDNNTVLVRPSPETSADWYLASEVFAKVSAAAVAPVWTTWLDARAVKIGQYTPLTLTFEHPGGPLTVSFGYRGRWPFRVNGWFFDGLSLERIGETQPPAPVPPPPEPAPTTPGELEELRTQVAALRAEVNQLRLERTQEQLRVDELVAERKQEKIRMEALEGKNTAMLSAWEATLSTFEKMAQNTRDLLAGRVPTP